MESRGFLVKGTAKPGFTGRRRGSRENSVYCRGGDTASESHGDDGLPVKRRPGIQEREDAEAVCGPGFPGKTRIYERGMKGKRPAAGTFGGQKRQRSNRWRRLLSRAERHALGRGDRWRSRGRWPRGGQTRAVGGGGKTQVGRGTGRTQVQVLGRARVRPCWAVSASSAVCTCGRRAHCVPGSSRGNGARRTPSLLSGRLWQEGVRKNSNSAKTKAFR